MLSDSQSLKCPSVESLSKLHQCRPSAPAAVGFSLGEPLQLKKPVAFIPTTSTGSGRGARRARMHRRKNRAHGCSFLARPQCVATTKGRGPLTNGNNGSSGVPILSREPIAAVFKSRGFFGSFGVEIKDACHSEAAPLKDLNCSFHSALGSFFTRIRLGRRSSSRRRPVWSCAGSMISANALPSPRAKSAMA